MENQLTLHSHGVETQYKILDAVYYVSPAGKLSLSVEARIAERDGDAPRDLSLALRNLPFKKGVSALEIRDRHESWAPEDESPHAYVYSGFHHSHVVAQATVSQVRGGHLLLVLDIATDDVQFYDDRAKESRITGSVILVEAEPADLWAP